MTSILLATSGGLPSLHDPLRAAFMTHRERMVAAHERFDAEGWERSTRCDAWDRRQLSLHLRNAHDWLDRIATGQPGLTSNERFDPHTTPQTYVDEHADEAVAEVAAGHRAALDRTLDHFDRLGPTSLLEGQALWGAHVDWRLLAAHVLWDAVVHERDLLGDEARIDDLGLSIAVGYGTLMGSLGASFSGDQARCTFGVSGPDATVDVECAAGTLTVQVDSGGTGPAAGAVIDCFAGRGDAIVDELVTLPEPFAGSIAGFRDFLSG